MTLIDKTGKNMFEPIAAREIGPYRQGRASLLEDEESYSYIDVTGTRVITGLGVAEPFADNGLALVRQAGEQTGFEYMDVDGNIAF